LTLPSLRFVLDGNVTLEASAETYMEGAISVPWTGTRELVNRIYVNEPEGAVLGMNMQRDYDISYDLDRIGFARADCKPNDAIKSILIS
jgi:hypothetical protein